MTRSNFSPAPAGRLLRLSGGLSLDGIWLGPATAALAGFLAGSALQLSAVVPVFVLLLLADLGWGNLWWAIAATDWAGPQKRWQSWLASSLPDEGSTRLLPYARPNGPFGRLARWGQDLLDWVRIELLPARGEQLGAILLGVPVALALSAALGPLTVLLTLGVLSVSQLALFLAPAGGRPGAFAQAIVLVAIPWCAGAALVDTLTPWTLATCAGLLLAYLGLVTTTRGGFGAGWLAAGHGLWVVILFALRQPLLATVVGGACFAQLAMLPWRRSRPDGEGLDGGTLFRLAQWPFIAAMFVVGLAL